MENEIKIRVIARIHTDFASKFGVPRQAGLVKELKSEIVFEPEYRNPDAVRGLEGFDYIWLLWQFSQNVSDDWSPTVRPPRLGGNTRMGVFATRSPFRPNNIGLSSVKLDYVEMDPERGPVIHVLGADLMDGTPIVDIKPYAPYADCHPGARGGFTDDTPRNELKVCVSDELLSRMPEDRRQALIGVLACDPRPSYHRDPERVYGFGFAGHEVKFQVCESILTVIDII